MLCAKDHQLLEEICKEQSVPSNDSYKSKNQEDSLRSYNASVMTFEQLIEHAKASYKDHLEAQKKITKIQQIVDKL